MPTIHLSPWAVSAGIILVICGGVWFLTRRSIRQPFSFPHLLVPMAGLLPRSPKASSPLSGTEEHQEMKLPK